MSQPQPTHSATPTVTAQNRPARAWPRHPLIYEINTWVWLDQLGRQRGRDVDLACVPDDAWEAIAAAGYDAVWLMGVWQRSPAGIAIANRNDALRDEFSRVLADFAPPDNVGSPYCVRRYVVAAQLGGNDGLASARRALGERGVRLLLDFVPNHVAPDHHWIVEHPDYFIQGDADDLHREPAAYIDSAGGVLACGRDPYFPAWPDVVQVNAFSPELRAATIATVKEIAAQCDGVRCDMAMLMLNAVFARTWGERAGTPPAEDYWSALIPAVRASHPDFCFIAEAYWGLEWELQQQGFSFCYDKTLYDRLARSDTFGVRQHLLAEAAYQQKLLRFIENHDEARAATIFGAERERAAAVATLTLPGARLVHDGQSVGRKKRLPVFLGRLPDEDTDRALADFYVRLLAEVNRDVVRNGEWCLCLCEGWPDNQSCRQLLAWSWQSSGESRGESSGYSGGQPGVSADDERCLIVVNYAPTAAQARVRVPWGDLAAESVRLDDVLARQSYERSGSEITASGLYVDLAPWHYHFFLVSAA